MSGLQGQSTLSAAEKVTEVRKHVDYLQDFLEQMAGHERAFVVRVTEQLESYGERMVISNKQLFWLRDLSLKY
jgi:hypothetical protein